MTVLNGFAVGKTVVVLGSADELILGYGLMDAFVPLPSILQRPSAILEISLLQKIHPNSVFVLVRGYATRLEVWVEHAFKFGEGPPKHGRPCIGLEPENAGGVLERISPE